MIPTTYFDYFFATERHECAQRETAEFAALDDDAWQEEMRYATDDAPRLLSNSEMEAELEDYREWRADEEFNRWGC